MSHATHKILTMALILTLLISGLTLPAAAQPAAAPAAPVTITILHTNDFHGQLEPSGSNPGAARVAQKIVDVRTAVGADKVLVLDAGDVMQGSLLSNIQKGLPTIDYYRTIGYNAFTPGNHEFDWGQTVLGERIAQAEAAATADETPVQVISANITKKDAGGNCTWEPFNAAVTPYEVFTVGTAPDTVKVGVIGVGSVETPFITVASATEGLCFRDPYESIVHYYDALDAASDVIVVLSHNGYNDGGYGYGFTVYGDQTLAKKLAAAGKKPALIIGGHSHTDLTAATMVEGIAVVQAHYNGRKVGRADITVNPDGTATVAWQRIVVGTSDPKYPPIDALVTEYANDPDYLALVNQPIGYSQVDLLRNYNGDAMMGNFVDDAIYGALNSDATTTNDVDMFFNNPGGIRINWCDLEDPDNPGTYIWTSDAANCQAEGVWDHDPLLLTYGQMFQILPFGNATVVGEMTGAQIMELLNQAATLFKGAIQPSGIRYKFFRYSDELPGPQPYAWGAFEAEVYDKTSATWVPLDTAKTYKVGTNEFLAPAGQDGFTAFKYMTNITYWGDMLDAVNAYVSAHYTAANPYKGPNGDGLLDGRITRLGDNTFDTDPIIPLTILHNNDSHGRLAKGTYVGYTQLASLIKQERAHNPDRTLVLNAGDQIQGDAMMYYFKSAPLGYAADGTPLDPPLTTHPMMAVMNAIGYDAMTVGNHEYNFGKEIFTNVLKQADFPILQANVVDDGSYGIAQVPVEPYLEKTVGPENIKVAILGIGNHRVPNYELPSNIPGLTFPNPLTTAQNLSDALRPTNDVVVALTHIGFAENPASVEVDTNVDVNMAKTVSGLDAIIGGHSHTNPATGFAPYKYLPTIIPGPNNTPVIVNHAYRYNNTLGELVIGVRQKAGGGYEVVSRAGRYLTVAMDTPEDADIKTIVDPYDALLSAYNNTVIGQTTVPIDALQAFTQETNAANLQADASVYELESHGIVPDFHLSGAMTNRAVAADATPENPVTLKVSDMFTLMPYENSLVTMRMNGPQLKAVLERAYRNYYYYKYVPDYGGYSHYTTCMLDINMGGKITYNDLYPAAYDPNVSHVVSLEFDGKEVDFADADTYYLVSTVNYLAAGSCNFNDGGVSLWPLDQIVNDTQYYVRDAVINYITAQGTVSPTIEGRLNFIYDVDAPAITINAPAATTYMHPEFLTLDFDVVDVGPAGLGFHSVAADLDGVPVSNGQVIDLYTLALGSHTFTVNAVDRASNASSASVTFMVDANAASLIDSLNRFYAEGKIDNAILYNALLNKLQRAVEFANAGQKYVATRYLEAFIRQVETQSGKHIDPAAADLLIADAQWAIAHM